MSSTVGELQVKIGADLAELQGALNKVKQDLGDVDSESKQAAGGLSDIQSILGVIGASKAIDFLKQQLVDAVKASIEFESAMAGVAKTTDLSKSEVEDYGGAIKDMAEEIPLTTTELAGISEAAGQLGISGAENLLAFTDVMAKLGVATNMTSEEAATMLAQFANITSMDSSQYSNLGATIVDLGNNFATTESKITEMAQGMAASATNAGIAEPEILALAAATSSVGIEAAAGSTSWAQLIQKMQSAVETGNDLDKWAAASGMSASDFKKAWGQNATGAINSFITGLKKSSDGGKSMISTLTELGITETRQQRLVQSLANAGDLLTRSIGKANSAWEDNSALNTEAATRFATTESKVTLLQNKFSNLQETIGSQLSPAFNGILDILTSATEGFEEFAEQNEWVGPVLAGVTVATIAYVGAMGAKIAIDKIATIVQQGLNAAVLANPYVLLATAIIGATVALVSWIAEASKASAEMEAMKSSAEDLAEAQEDSIEANRESIKSADSSALYIQHLADRVDTLGKKSKLTSKEQRELQWAIDELNESVDGLNLTIEDVNGGLDSETERIIEVAKAEAKAQVIKEKYEEQLRRQIEAQELQYQAEQQLLEEKQKLSDADQAELEKIEALKIAAEESDAVYDELVTTTLGASAAVQEYLRGETALADAQANCNAVIESTNAEMTYLSGTLFDATGSTDALKSSTEGLSDEEIALAEATDEAASGIMSELNSLSSEYVSAKAVALDNIQSQINKWDELKAETDVSIKSMISGYESQIKYMQDYTTNMKSLLDRNIAGLDDWVKANDDGSAEAAGAFAALADATDEEVEAMITAWKNSQTEQTNFSESVGQMQTDYDDRMKDIMKSTEDFVAGLDMSDEAKKATSSTIQSVVNTASDMASDVSAAYRSMMNAAVNELQRNVTLKLSVNGKTGTTSGTVTPHYDSGGYITQPQLAMIAEKRPEFVGAAEDLQTFINRSVQNAFIDIALPNIPIPAYQGNRSGDINIKVDVPMSISKQLSDADIKAKAKQITNIVSREFVNATGGLMQ